MESGELFCCKCGVPLVSIKSKLSYMGFNASYEFPRCPVCGQIFVSEELVKGKMKELEMTLEDK